MPTESSDATLLRRGLIVDGSGRPGYVGDVLLVGDRLAAVGQVSSALLDAHAGFQSVDCQGRVLAPGFIDVHTHDDAAVLDQPAMLPKLSQGICTVVVGNCGISLVPVLSQDPPGLLKLLGPRQFRHPRMSDYAAAVAQARPAVNVAALVGHSALRIRHMSDLNRPADATELAAMQADLRDAMAAGALGLSSGVFYQEAYAADLGELVALASVAALAGGVYATHIRDELDAILPALLEAAGTARQAGLPLVISHHKCAGPANWGRTRETLPLLEALARDQELGLDVYPYTAGSTVLRTDLVDGVIDILITGSRPHPEMAGRQLADIAREWGVSQQQACERLMPGGACYFQMHQDDVDRVVSHPLSMIGSDGLPHDERPHPRLWGAFPRVLSRYWRETGMLSLESAIHKMTGLSARRFRMVDRGELRPGAYADLVVLDPARVRDRATFDQPEQFSEGIEQVWVNGVLSFVGGERQERARAGRFLPRKIG